MLESFLFPIFKAKSAALANLWFSKVFIMLYHHAINEP